VIVNGTATFDGTDYALKQFHFHTPSEHRIDEEYFPLEMHMVHEATGASPHPQNQTSKNKKYIKKSS
jgi:carbonic anhydrase